MITLTDSKNNIIDTKLIEFSDGAINIEVPPLENKITGINWHVDDVTKETVQLQYLIDALEYMGVDFNRRLYIPYLPNARADRIFNRGNARPLERFMVFLSSLHFHEVIVYDVHSDEALKLAERYNIPLKNQSQHSIILSRFRNEIKDSTIVAPDKGAIHKVLRLCEKSLLPFVNVEKRRSLDTGKILSVDVPNGDYSGKKFTIADDICDGGGTFIPIAKQLKEMGAKEVNLYVTHGIFSKGLDLFDGCIDNIYVANIVGKYVTTHCIQKFNSK